MPLAFQRLLRAPATCAAAYAVLLAGLLVTGAELTGRIATSAATETSAALARSDRPANRVESWTTLLATDQTTHEPGAYRRNLPVPRLPELSAGMLASRIDVAEAGDRGSDLRRVRVARTSCGVRCEPPVAMRTSAGERITMNLLAGR